MFPNSSQFWGPRPLDHVTKGFPEDGMLLLAPDPSPQLPPGSPRSPFDLPASLQAACYPGVPTRGCRGSSTLSICIRWVFCFMLGKALPKLEKPHP